MKREFWTFVREERVDTSGSVDTISCQHVASLAIHFFPVLGDIPITSRRSTTSDSYSCSCTVGDVPVSLRVLCRGAHADRAAAELTLRIRAIADLGRVVC